MPNPWDAGAARLLAAAGFTALATTSSGHAATLGLPDGSVTREEAMAHAAAIVGAVDTPVSADLESGFGATPDAVHTTITQAAAVGLAGASVEDSTGDPADPIRDLETAVERVAAAVQAARDTGAGFVLTARAENFIHGIPDLADTITRLQAFQEAGADVLYAPGLTDIADIRAVITSVDRPVNVLTRPGLPSVPDLARAGVARISVGGAFHQVAMAALSQAAHELRNEGTYGFLDRKPGN